LQLILDNFDFLHLKFYFLCNAKSIILKINQLESRHVDSVQNPETLNPEGTLSRDLNPKTNNPKTHYPEVMVSQFPEKSYSENCSQLLVLFF